MSVGGGLLSGLYMAIGAYYVVNIGEFPNDEAYTTTLLEVASRSAVRATTLKAFTKDGYRLVIAAIPA
jgi:uncharacterized protein with GYD domain